MPILAPKDRIRFQISENGTAFSDQWSVWRNGKDIYLAPKQASGVQKVSFHESGVCRWAITSQLHSHNPPMPRGHRAILEWKRETHLDKILHTQVLSLRFIPITRGATAHSKPFGKARQLPYPPDGGCIEVCAFYSATNPWEWDSRTWLTSNILGVWKLNEDCFAAFRWRLARIPSAEKELLVRSSWQTPTKMVVGEEDPTLFATGIYDGLIGRVIPGSAQLDCLVAMSNTMPGAQSQWHTRTGHKYDSQSN